MPSVSLSLADPGGAARCPISYPDVKLALYLAWCEWCHAAGLVPGSETMFGRAMRAHGADFRKNSSVFYRGFTLRERAAWAPASVVQRDGGAA